MKQNFIAGFTASNFTLKRNLDEISDFESIIQPKLKGNCINWNAGHILMVRDQMLTMFNCPSFLTEKETSYYASGSKPINDVSERIPIGKIKEGLDKTFKTLIENLSEVDNTFLNNSIPNDKIPVPIPEPTVAKLFAILLYHEGYHTGQIGLSRRLLGKEFNTKL